METVIIVIHLMVVAALVAVVLLQRSEGGALGIGGGSNFLTTRGQGNVLTRATAVLAGAFFATSIVLTILARISTGPTSILDTIPGGQPAVEGEAGGGGGGGILDQLPTPQAITPPVPADAPPAPPADAAPAANGESPAATPADPAPGVPNDR